MPTLALVLSDVEGSTRLWERHPDAMAEAMERHHAIVHAAVDERGRRPPDQGEGDAVFAVFDSVADAVAAVLRFQRELAAEPWPPGIRIRDRVAVHVGEVTVRRGNVLGAAVHRTARLRGLAVGGQTLLSSAAVERLGDALPAGAVLTDLGPHRLRDLAEPEHVHQLVPAGLPGDFPPLPDGEEGRDELPVPGTPFIGRERETAQVTAELARHRLVSLVGFGGIGKTRLALQVAHDLVGTLPDGVWFVDLSLYTDVGLAAAAVVGALHVAETPEGPEAALLAGLRYRRLLLVLDNLEQLLPGIDHLVAALVERCPGARVLATSRRPLHLRAEHLHRLEPLPVPDGTEPVEALADRAAVALLLDRAAALGTDFTLTAGNAAAVAAICVRLEGLPLALELAAARLAVLSPEALLARLDPALPVLTGGGADLPDRQRTLRATIAWSFDALEPALQRLIGRLAVFPGTFDLAAAEAVAASSDVVDALTALVDASLVRALDGGRFALLVPIREFAAERVDPADAADAATRHATHYADLLHLPADWSADEAWANIARVALEGHNVRAALDHLHRTGDVDRELDLGVWAGVAMVLLGRTSERRRMALHALSHLPEPPETPLHLLVLMGAAWADSRSGLPPAQDDAAVRLVAASRRLGEPATLVQGLVQLADGHRDLAAELLAEAEAVLRTVPERGSALPRWFVLDNWSLISIDTGFFDAERALEYGRQAVEAAVGMDVSRTRYNLGEALVLRGRFTEAVDVLELFEHPLAATEAVPVVQVLGALTAAQARIALGQPAAAERDLRLAEAGIRAADVPEEAAQAELLHALVERALGRPAAAAARLDAVLRAAPDQDAVGRFRWLRAVLHRDAGDLGAAAAAVEAVRTAGDPDLERLVRLERAAQRLDTDPAEAAGSVAQALAERAPGIAVLGSVYDLGAMLRRARSRLGTGAGGRVAR